MSEQFFKEEGEVYRKELKNTKIPSRVFRFKKWIWRPKNYIIEKSNGRYTLSKEKIIEIPTSYPFWRLLNSIIRVYTWWNNGMLLAYTNFTSGPLSFRRMFSKKPYYIGCTIDYSTGKIIPTNKVEPVYLTVKSFWKSVFEKRKQFESKPDTSLIGKSLTRPFNIIWEYVFKGAIPTIFFCTSISIGTVLSQISSLLALTTSFIWAPISSYLKYLFNIMIYDLDSSFLYYLSFDQFFPIQLTVVRTVLALVETLQVTFFLSGIPAASYCIVIVNFIRTFARILYDSLMFNLIVKKHGRIPSSNSFLAHRVEGPGISSEYVYTIDPTLALTIMKHELESIELENFKKYANHHINMPLKHFHDIHAKLLGPFASQLDTNHLTYREISRRSQQLLRAIDKIVSERRKRRNIRGHIPKYKKVKLAED